MPSQVAREQGHTCLERLFEQRARSSVPRCDVSGSTKDNRGSFSIGSLSMFPGGEIRGVPSRHPSHWTALSMIAGDQRDVHRIIRHGGELWVLPFPHFERPAPDRWGGCHRSRHTTRKQSFEGLTDHVVAPWPLPPSARPICTGMDSDMGGNHETWATARFALSSQGRGLGRLVSPGRVAGQRAEDALFPARTVERNLFKLPRN